MSPITPELTVRQAVAKRRSVRQYTADPIPEADLREIVRLAGAAPSPMNVQPWRFVIVRDPALKAKLQVAANNQAQVGRAPAVIVLYADMPDALAHAVDAAYPDLAPEARAAYAARIARSIGAMDEAARTAWGHAISYIALGYLLLAAESLGYVTSPMLGFKPDQVKELLALPAHVTIPAIVALGVPAETGHDPHRHPVDRIATIR